MITVIEFVLRAVSGGGLPWFVGHECRAGLIDLISKFDPDLGSVFHEGLDVGGRRKVIFSLKPLRFVSDFEVVFPEKSFRRFLVDGNVVFRPGARASMSVAVFRDDLASRFVARLLSGVSELRINVKGYEFEVDRLGFEVMNPREVVRGELFEEVDVEFITPTYFNPLRGDARYKILYPDLTLMFASLISISHQLTDISYPRPEELAELTYISGLEIKTPYIKEMGHEAPTGFVGWVKLRIKKEVNDEVRRMIAGLLKLGEITNIGGNRSGGYGVIKLKTERENVKTLNN